MVHNRLKWELWKREKKDWRMTKDKWRVKEERFRSSGGVAPLGKNCVSIAAVREKGIEDGLPIFYLHVWPCICLSPCPSCCLFISVYLSASLQSHTSVCSSKDCKLNIWDSLSVLGAYAFAWSPSHTPAYAFIQPPVARPRLYSFFFLSSLSFLPLLSRRDGEGERVRDGRRRRRTGVGGDHRGDEVVWCGWKDRCIDKGCRLHSTLAA